MNPLYVRDLTDLEIKELAALEESLDGRLSRRAKLILLSAEHHFNASELEKKLHMDVSNVCHWIHKFNSLGMEGILPKGHPGRKPKFDQAVRHRIVDLANTPPQDLGQPFKRWTLTKLACYLKEQGVVDSISHEQVRQIIKRAGPELVDVELEFAVSSSYRPVEMADMGMLVSPRNSLNRAQDEELREDVSSRRARRRRFNPIRWVSGFIKPVRPVDNQLAGGSLRANDGLQAGRN